MSMILQRTTLELPDDLNKRYQELAQQAGQSPETVMMKALEAYLVQIGEEDARLAAAIAAVARREVVDAEVVHAEDEALLAGLGLPPEQLAAIREEVEREAVMDSERLHACRRGAR